MNSPTSLPIVLIFVIHFKNNNYKKFDMGVKLIRQESNINVNKIYIKKIISIIKRII